MANLFCRHTHLKNCAALNKDKGHRQSKGDAPVLLSAMCTPVLLHKSACASLGKAQILINHKKFFPIPLPKSSFEGMRDIFLCHIIRYAPRSISERMYRHHNQKPISQFEQSADFSKNAKNIFLNPLKSPFKE